MPRRPSDPPDASAKPRRARLLALVTSALMVSPAVAAEPLAAPKRAVRAPKGDESNSPNVTFTGFRRLSDGRALVYVELTGKVPVSVIRQQGALIYRLEGARVALKNNKNPLLTGAFATNLLSARLVTPKPARKAKGRGKEATAHYVDVVLNLRSGVTPTHVMSERPGGAVLEITIPAAGGK